MVNICVNVPVRLKEGLKLRAQDLNLKTSDIIREALWKAIQDSDAETSPLTTKKNNNNTRQNALEEQIYFIRCLVENIGLTMDGGGEDFVDECHLRKEKLLKMIR